MNGFGESVYRRGWFVPAWAVLLGCGLTIFLLFGISFILASCGLPVAHAQEYLSDDYSYPNGRVPSPEVVPAPQHMTRGLNDSDYGYTDDMGWHGYPNGTPDPGGNCWASFRC